MQKEIKPRHAAIARILPFAAYILLMACAPHVAKYLGEAAKWWYALQIGVTAGMLAYFWPQYSELRTKAQDGAQAKAWLWVLLGGVGVFVAWIHLDLPGVSWGQQLPAYIPVRNGQYDWPWIVMRLAGSCLLVPVMEELFWRSFIMRWIDVQNFMQHPASQASLRAVLFSSVVFGLEHNLWFAGVIAGIVYAAIYRQTHLRYAVYSHALTNFLLGLWVIKTGQWQFW